MDWQVDSDVPRLLCHKQRQRAHEQSVRVVCSVHYIVGKAMMDSDVGIDVYGDRVGRYDDGEREAQHSI